MKKTVVFMLVFTSAILAAPQAARAFFLEPSLHYETGKGRIETSLSSVDGTDTNVSGTGFGLKAGLSFLIPFVGVDLMYTQPDYELGGNNLPEGSGNSLWAGLVAGAKLPLVGLRAWASYFPYGAMTIGEDLILAGGSAVKFGTGFSLIPMVSLNIEYMMQEFGEVEDKSSGGSGELPSASYTNNSVFISLSIPL